MEREGGGKGQRGKGEKGREGGEAMNVEAAKQISSNRHQSSTPIDNINGQRKAYNDTGTHTHTHGRIKRSSMEQWNRKEAERSVKGTPSG